MEQQKIVGIEKNRYFDRDNFSEEEERIKQEQISAIEVIYHNGLDDLADFIDCVENKRIAGARASVFLKDEEIRHFIEHSTDVDQDEFLEGLVTACTFDRSEQIIQDFSDDVKAQILDKLPLSDKLVLYIKSLDIKAQEIFWKKTDAWGYMNDSYTMLEDTVSSLNYYHRTDKSLR